MNLKPDWVSLMIGINDIWRPVSYTHLDVYKRQAALSGKKIALFGSYGWGDGEWMRSWESRCNDDGANLACESVICNEAPDDDALAACRELGASLA